MRRVTFGVSVVLCLVTVPAFGVEVEINQDAWTYADSDETTTVSGTKTERSSTDESTFPNSLEVVAHLGQWHVYAYPTQPGTALALGYDVMEQLEVGLSLGFNNSSVKKPKSHAKQSEYGVFGVYAVPMGKVALEIGASYAVATADKLETDTSGAITEDSETDTSTMALGVEYIHPIVEGFSYIFGLGYQSQSSEEKNSKTKVEQSTLSLSLVKFRYEF